MNCPVCKTECNNETVCLECGFTEVGKVFLNIEDANQWVENVVIPYRAEFEKRHILPMIDWLNMIKKNSQAKALFEISIPAALIKQLEINQMFSNSQTNPWDMSDQQRELLIESQLGHVLLISKEDIIAEKFVIEMKKALNKTVDVKDYILNSDTRQGDLAAMLTNHSEKDIAVFRIAGKVKKEVLEIIPQALNDYALDIPIGKGPSAQGIRINLPIYTAIFICEKENDITQGIVNCMEYKIDLTVNEEELQELYIRDYAEKYDILLSRESLDVIKSYLSKTTIKSLFRLITDYLFINKEVQQPISSQSLDEILGGMFA